ncbi:mannose-1-phosphate guanylyltransferase [Patescibacteria group bacterium]
MKDDHANFYIVIRAGGAGTRLWPLSTEKSPKQFCDLVDRKSMLENTLERLQGVVPKENIYISTSVKFEKLVGELVPDFPKKNLILEPARRDTAAAVALESAIIYKRDPEAIIASIGSDHLIKRVGEFVAVLNTAKEFIAKSPKHLLLIGIKPTTPSTGFGYVQKDKTLITINKRKVYIVRRFTEKPDQATAKSFFKSKNYFWNGNLFVWRANTILDLFQKFKPQIYSQIMEISKFINKNQFSSKLNKIYPQIEKTAIDYAILEKYDQIATIEADMGWSDIGDWQTLKTELCPDKTKSLKQGKVVEIDSKNNLLYQTNSKKLLTVIGLDNIGVVDTGDALMICDLKKSQDVKKLTEKLKNEKSFQKYL